MNTKSLDRRIAEAREKIEQADAILVGAGAGLSYAAGFDYSKLILMMARVNAY